MRMTWPEVVAVGVLGCPAAILPRTAVSNDTSSVDTVPSSTHQASGDQRGTVDQPVVVRVIPQTEDSEKTAQEQRDRAKKAESDALLASFTGELARWTRWLALLTMGLVVAAAVQVVMFFRQLKVMKQDLQDAQVVARAARDSADAARESLAVERQTMIDGGRAYVQHYGIRWVSHRLEATENLIWRLHPGWYNVGNTPTRKLRVRVHYTLTDTPLAADFAFAVDYLPALGRSTLSPKESMESPVFDVTAADLVLVKNETKHLYVWGGAEYDDVFAGTPQRTTKFCVKAGLVTGDPSQHWHSETNPVHIRWNHVAGHNFMDDDREVLA